MNKAAKQKGLTPIPAEGLQLVAHHGLELHAGETYTYVANIFIRVIGNDPVMVTLNKSGRMNRIPIVASPSIYVPGQGWQPLTLTITNYGDAISFSQGHSLATLLPMSGRRGMIKTSRGETGEEHCRKSCHPRSQ